MLKYIKRIPLIRLLLPFVLGLVSCAFLIEEVKFSQEWAWGILAGELLLFPILIKLRKTQYRWRWLFGVGLFVSFMGIGFLTTLLHSKQIFPASLVNDGGQETEWLIQIEDEPVEKARSIKLVAIATSVKRTDLSGKILVYLEKSDRAKELSIGDKLLVKASLNTISTPGNPNEFNYPRYLRFNSIFKQTYITQDRWLVVERASKIGLLGSLRSLRTKLLEKLDKNVFSGQERAIIAALTLGYKQELEPETTRAFAGAGAMHVLAVSGLHVGIIYSMLMGALAFLTKIKRGDLYRAILVVLILIGYAILTGMSASVFRAVTMFSFVAWAKATKRYSNIYNTLTASAFVLLLFDPYLIMQVGFQLSYAAVLGIVFIQPWLFSLYVFENRFVDKIWSLTCVSLAAQVATFPLGLLYFHQFPNYFLFSNWIVIPLATFIMYVGLGFFGLSFISQTLAVPLAYFLKLLALGLSKFVAFVQALPFSMLAEIDISVLDTLLIYTIIISAFVLVIHHVFKVIYPMVIASALVLVLQISETIVQSEQQEMIVYNVRKGFAVDLVSGVNHMFVANSELLSDKNSMLFHVEHHWWAKGLKEPERMAIDSSEFSSKGLLISQNGTVTWIAPPSINFVPKSSFNRLILTGIEGDNWEHVLSNSCPDQVVLSQNIFWKPKELIKTYCGSLGIDFVEIGESGPFLF